MPRFRSTHLALFLGLAALFANAAPSLADHEPPRLGLTPVGQAAAYFELTMEPGERLELAVELANFGHDEVQARTYAADVYSIVNGGFGAELFGQEPSAPTTWLDYEAQELTLGPADARTIRFSITVPAETEPGQYVTSIVVENAEPYEGAGEDGVRLEQVNRSAIAVAVDVPGPRRPGLEIGSVGHHVAGAASVITFDVRNTGNVHLEPSGDFLLRDAAGTEIASAPLGLDSIYAGMATTLEAPLASLLAPGGYCALLALSDEEAGASDEIECLPFAVEAPVQIQSSGGAGPFEGIPVLQPAIEAASENPLLAGLTSLAALLLVAAGLALALRRRSR